MSIARHVSKRTVRYSRPSLIIASGGLPRSPEFGYYIPFGKAVKSVIKIDKNGYRPLVFAILSAVLPIAAQTGSSQAVPKVTFSYLAAPDHPAQAKAKPGSDSLTLNVRVELQDGWHINSEAPLDSFLVPTTLDIQSDGIKFGKPRFPQAMIQQNKVMGDLSLFTGIFNVQVPAKRVKKSTQAASPAPAVPGGVSPVTALSGRTRVTLNYQACNNSMCLPPKSITVEQ